MMTKLESSELSSSEAKRMPQSEGTRRPLGTARPRPLLQTACVLVAISGVFFAGFSSKAALLDSAQRYINKVARSATNRTNATSATRRFRLPKPDEFHPQDAATSNVRLVNGTVVKTPKSYLEYNAIARGVCILKRLQRFPAFPRLVNYTATSLRTSFAGNRATADTLPDDYREQFQQILADMESVGVKHNDIMFQCSLAPGKWEVLVWNRRLSLIDFGWATVSDEVPCNVSTRKFVPGWTPCPDHTFLQVLDGMAHDKAARENATAAAAHANATCGRRRRRRRRT